MKNALAGGRILMVAAAVLGTTSAGWAASIQSLGATFQLASAISADGSTVVGTGPSTQGNEARVWRNGQVTDLGVLAGSPVFNSGAYGVSADGSVVVGYSRSPNTTNNEAFVWTASGGMRGLGVPSGSNASSEARAVSADGSVIVGWSASGTTPLATTIWRAGAAAVQVGPTATGTDTGFPMELSSDGSVISVTIYKMAYRWTASSGMVSLGDLPGGLITSDVYGMSSDGNVVVGKSGSANSGFYASEAFMWTQATGMVGLGDLPGGKFNSQAEGVTADGSIVVGRGQTSADYEAFIWDATHGMRSLKSALLSDYGFDVGGWSLLEASGISADGRTIIGTGRDPSGATVPFVINLNTTAAAPVPGAVGLGLVGLAGLGLGGMRRRRP